VTETPVGSWWPLRATESKTKPADDRTDGEKVGRATYCKAEYVYGINIVVLGVPPLLRLRLRLSLGNAQAEMMRGCEPNQIRSAGWQMSLCALASRSRPNTYEIRATPDLVYKPLAHPHAAHHYPNPPTQAMRLSSYTHFILFFLGALVSAAPVRPSAPSLLALD
jgi:hypothetical protein